MECFFKFFKLSLVLTISSSSGILAATWSCDFETVSVNGPWCSMLQSQSDQTDWKQNDYTTHNGNTPSGSSNTRLNGNLSVPATGPEHAQSGNYYIHLEATDITEGDKATIFLPYVGSQSYCLSFHYNMNGFHTGELQLIETANEASAFNVLFSIAGDQMEQWYSKNILISGISSQTKIGFVAIRGSGFSGDIALDNIALDTNIPQSNCSGLTAVQVTPGTIYDWSCNFESLDVGGPWCGVTQSSGDEFDWLTNDYDKNSGRTPSGYIGNRTSSAGTAIPVTGPEMAYSGSSYSYIETSGGGLKGNRAIMYLPFISGTSYCLKFYYNMNGFHVNELQLVSTVDEAAGYNVLWNVTGDQQSSWFSKSVLLSDVGKSTKIGFVGLHGGYHSGDIALDMVSIQKNITESSCQGLAAVSTTSGTFIPLTTESQVASIKTEVTLIGTPAWSCSFETTDTNAPWCGMIQSNIDSFDWLINNETVDHGRTPSGYPDNRTLSDGSKTAITGPEAAQSGTNYAYIEASHRTNGDKAILYMPTHMLYMPQAIPYASLCLSFYVSMNGFHINEFQLVATENEAQGYRVLWNMTGDQGGVWLHHLVLLSGISPNTKIGFIGITDGFFSGDIAIDSLAAYSDLDNCQALPNTSVTSGSLISAQQSTVLSTTALPNTSVTSGSLISAQQSTVLSTTASGNIYWSCDFELIDSYNSWCGLTQSTNDNFDWTRNDFETYNGKTESGSGIKGWDMSRNTTVTGPEKAQSGMFYMYIETSEPRMTGDKAIIFLPSINQTQYCLSFYYNLNGQYTDQLLLVSTLDETQGYNLLWKVANLNTQLWSQHTVLLTDVSAATLVGFVGIRGAEFSGDIAVDNISVTSDITNSQCNGISGTSTLPIP